MILKTLALRQFRNHHRLSISFSPQVNEIVGGNGAGKSNLIEAIYLLSLARSWRTNEIKNMLEFGTKEAYIKGEIEEAGISKKIEIILKESGRAVLINSSPLSRLSELSGMFNTVLFTPEDTHFFRASPGVRRLFLDESLAKISPEYLMALRSFRHLLLERNAVLKSIKDELMLETLTKQLIKEEKVIVSYRKKFLSQLEPLFKKTANALFGEKRTVSLLYRPFLEEENFEEKAITLYEKYKERDCLAGMTQVGPHREDFMVMLDEKEASNFASQGEGRLLALALKISPSLLFSEEKKPVAILDDVFGELDAKHGANLAKFLPQLGQTFLTGTEPHIYGSKTITL